MNVWKRPGECQRCHRLVLAKGVRRQLDEMEDDFVVGREDMLAGWNQDKPKQKRVTCLAAGEGASFHCTNIEEAKQRVTAITNIIVPVAQSHLQMLMRTPRERAKLARVGESLFFLVRQARVTGKVEMEEAVPKLTRSASDMLRKKVIGLVLVTILGCSLSLNQPNLTTVARTIGRMTRGKTRFPATIVRTNQASWLKASAGAFSVTTWTGVYK